MSDASLAIHGNRLSYVGPRMSRSSAVPGGVSEIDLGGATVMPGLMDMHTHLSLIYPVGAQPPGWRETIPWHIARNAERALEAGITLCRTTGEADHLDIAYRKAMDAGLARGPRLICAGRGITPTGGHGSDSPWYVEADGPEGFREAARRELKSGADHLKLMLTMGIGVAPSLRGVPRITASEARAVVDVAHASGRRVCAHNGGAEGAILAVGAGVDCLEHCYTLDEDAVQQMGDARTYVVPTLCVTNSADFLREMGTPDERLKILEQEGVKHLEWFARAVRAGARPAVGTDMLPTDRPETADVPIAEVWEIELMVRAGLSPMAALQAATRNAAELCQVEDRLGTLEPGKLADLIAMPGDPSSDITALRDIRFVMQDGIVVRNEIHAP